MTTQPTPLPVAVHSLHRVATPITPIHSPHQSLNSTPSRTPVHTLTLHEYRKQQNTPSPQSIATGRRLKRKVAASGLNTIERIPPAPSTPVQHSPPSSSSSYHSQPEKRSDRRTGKTALRRSPSFTSLLANAQHQPSVSISSAPQDPGGTNLDYPSTDEAENFYRSGEHFETFKKPTFKPIKRLPRPLPFSARPPVPSPLRSDTSTENLLSSAGLTTGSTFSLSRFPQPPQLGEVIPLSRASEPIFPHVNISITKTTPASPPATPAVVHYRGASFDLVNPHQSLHLHKIETPADRDADFLDYFQVRPSNELLRGPETTPQPMTTTNNSPYATDKMTPQRALFDDLPSAYQSIAGSNRTFQPPSTPNTDLPLPPTPVAFSPKSSTYSTPDQPYIERFAPAPLKINKPITSPSFMQRLSRAFTRKGHQAKPKSEPVGEELRYMSRGATPRVSRTYARPLSQNNQSAPAISMEEERDIEMPRAMEPASMSEGDLGHSGYYDVESLYPSSTIGGDGRDRSSVYPSSIFNRSSVPYGVQMAETDYSTEADLHSYTYQFSDSARSNERTSQGGMTQEFLRHPDMPNPEKTDTISKIIDNYGGVDVSETSLLDLMDEEDAEDTIRLSGFETQHSGISRQFINPGHSSGLSQFDFGLRRGSSSQGSTISGPKTPEQPNLFPRMPALFRGTAGLPPQAPLPLQPPIELEGPNPPFTRRDMSSEMFSNNSSYGDTRNLLLLSQPFSSFNVPRIQGPTEEPTSAPSELLPYSSNLETIQNDRDSSTDSRARKSPLNRIVNEQAKRLSQISTKSNLSGGIFVISTPGTPREEEDRRAASPVSPITLAMPGRPFDPSSSYSQGDGNSTPSEALAEAERLFSKPSDNQQISSSAPRVWRKPSPARPNESSERESPGKDSYADMNDEEDERDWETVAEQSRANLPREPTEESVADYSSYGGSMNTLGDVLVHPGDDRYAHTYKLSHSDTGRPVLLPSYNFQSGTGFPNRNALTPPRTASSPYRHPSPLSDHIHPFKSSPPPMSVKSKSSYSAFALDNVEQTPPMPNIGLVSEAHGLPQTSTSLNPKHRQENYCPTAHPYELSDKETMDLLNSGPNDTILYEEQDQMLHNEPTSTPLTSRETRPSDSTEGYMDSMQGQPPTTSSVLTERDNSFSKLTILGPRSNLTGTPLGTGMHEVGSSLADSSSPGEAWDSTPSRALENSSPAYYPSSSPPETQYASSPMTQFPTSPFTPFGTVEQGTPSHSPHGSKASNRSQDRLLLAHRRQRTREALLRSGAQGHRVRPKRASVRSQTKLREMVLTSTDASTIRTEDTRLSRFISSDRSISGETTSPLRTYHPVARLPSENSPHLLRHSPPSSPVYHKRKQRLSWILFAMLVWFPPFLVLYAFGRTDRLISYMSKGEVDECGRIQKRVALWVGITGSIIIPAVVILLLVLAHLSVI